MIGYYNDEKATSEPLTAMDGTVRVILGPLTRMDFLE